jgi:hypothetical protein
MVGGYVLLSTAGGCRFLSLQMGNQPSLIVIQGGKDEWKRAEGCANDQAGCVVQL